MPTVSKFSVWDEDVKAFLEEFCENMPKNKNKEVREWYYSEGVTIFQKTQAERYMKLEKDSLERVKKRPVVDGVYIKGQKFEGFLAVSKNVIEKFMTNDDDYIFANISAQTLCLRALTKYDGFYDISAKVTNDLNAILDTQDLMGKPLSPPEKLNIMSQLFISAKTEDNAKLNQQIDDHILLTKEVCAAIQAKTTATSTSIEEKIPDGVRVQSPLVKNSLLKFNTNDSTSNVKPAETVSNSTAHLTMPQNN